MRRRRRSNAVPLIAAFVVALAAVAGAWQLGLLPGGALPAPIGPPSPTALAAATATTIAATPDARVLSPAPTPAGASPVAGPASPPAGTPPPGTPSAAGAPAPAPVGVASATVPSAPTVPGAPTVALTPVPSPAPTPTGAASETAARQFLKAWENRQYKEMYGLLSKAAMGRIDEERFVGRYQAITTGSTILKIATSITGQPEIAGNQAQIPVQVVLETGRLGTITEQNQIRLVAEEGAWKVDWTPDLIFKDLGATNRVSLIPYDPMRGSIVDRNGKQLAIQGKVLTLGVIPGQIKDQTRVVQTLSEVLKIKPEDVKRKIDAAQPDWWVPYRDYPLDKGPEVQAKVKDIPGILLEEKAARSYPYGALMAHITGYTTNATAEDLKRLAARGYEETDVVGRTGVEAAAEEILGGVRGGKLAIVNPEGEVVRTIAERAALAGGTIQLSIDIDVQEKATRALGEKVGSVVILDPRDNGVLALVSNPSFDPNLFVTGISEEDWQKLNGDARRPFQNRPVWSGYATGSIFKVITMAAGMERGGYKADSQFTCTGRWDGLGRNQSFGDWKPEGHGKLDLREGLVQSCNIVFYEIAHHLNGADPNIIPYFARQFGIGEPTGINGLAEVPGILPDPEWKQRQLKQAWFPGDGVNLGIGQGYLEATPLQMANVYSTLANGGTLRTPLLIKEVTVGEPGRQQKRTFTAQEKRRVPINAATLAAIKEAMVRTTATATGTANYAFRGYQIPVASKTGSAENQNPDAHAWYAGFGPADQPRAVVIVMVEGGRMGSEVAAPIARKVFDEVLGTKP